MIKVMNSGIRGASFSPDLATVCCMIINLSASQLPHLYNVANNGAYHTVVLGMQGVRLIQLL